MAFFWSAARPVLIVTTQRPIDSSRSQEFPTAPSIEFAFARDGSLWLLEDGALEHFCPPSRCKNYKSLARYTSADGWPSATFTGMQVDANGIVWAAGPRGLWRYDPANRQVRLFGTQDGLISVEFNDAALVQRADGTLFGATLAGIVGFAPDRLSENVQAPKLVLDGATVMREGHAVALDVARPIALDWADRNLTFDARALSYVNPAGNRYRWKLEGYDTDWIDTAHRGERVFSQLPGGDYTLRVRAANASGVWTELASPVSVAQSPPPWLTKWAFAAYAVLAALGAALVTRAYRRASRPPLCIRTGAATAHVRRTVERGEIRFSRHDGPRNPHADDRRARHGRTVAAHAARFVATRIRRSDPGFRPRAACGSSTIRSISRASKPASSNSKKSHSTCTRWCDTSKCWSVRSPKRRGLSFSVSVAADVPHHVRGDAVRIEQVVLNLINNAIKFSERGDVSLDVVDCRRRRGLHRSRQRPGHFAGHARASVSAFRTGRWSATPRRQRTWVLRSVASW